MRSVSPETSPSRWFAVKLVASVVDGGKREGEKEQARLLWCWAEAACWADSGLREKKEKREGS